MSPITRIFVTHMSSEFNFPASLLDLVDGLVVLFHGNLRMQRADEHAVIQSVSYSADNLLVGLLQSGQKLTDNL